MLKFGGPRGVGWLVDQNSTRLQFGGGQEGGRRAGTENFPSIEAMAIAWEYCLSKSDDLEARSILMIKWKWICLIVFLGQR